MLDPRRMFETPDHLKSERVKAAEAVVREFIAGKDKIAMHPATRDSDDDHARHERTIYLDELNAFLRSRGFDDFYVEHYPLGQLSICSRAHDEFESREPRMPRGFVGL